MVSPDDIEYIPADDDDDDDDDEFEEEGEVLDLDAELGQADLTELPPAPKIIPQKVVLTKRYTPEGVHDISSASHVHSQEFQSKLKSILKKLQDAETLNDVLDDVQREALEALEAERMTIYQRDPNKNEIVSWFKTGDEPLEIRVPIAPKSIAGYVAMSHEALRIDDVYDDEYLRSIHPELSFDYRFDQTSGFLTRSMLVVPIMFQDTLLGVLQIINRLDGDPFSDYDMSQAQAIATLMGQKLSYDMSTTSGPFEYLVERQRITQAELSEYEKRSGNRNSETINLLMSEGGLTVDEIGASLANYYQVPFVKYDPFLALPTDLFSNLNKTYLIKNRWVPIAGDHDKVTILIDNPNDTHRIMEIQSALNAAAYEFCVGLEQDILQFLGVEIAEHDVEEMPDDANLDSLVERLGGEQRGGSGGGIDVEGSELVDEAAPTIVQLVNKIIADAVELNASDIHIEPGKGKNNAVVRMRVDGVCREVLKIPASHIRYVIARIKIMARLDISEKRLPQSGKIACRLQGQPLELRVETVPTVNGESTVMRVLAAGDPMPLDKLNLAPAVNERLHQMLTHPHGIILVVGPTGSGKTTTLHAILGAINTPDKKILTAEDPVEITQHGLQQCQMKNQIGFNFAAALRSFLRADPDVILIGEMRDKETAHAGIEASLTGHLVFSTLHTNSAPETVTRLLDMGLDPLNFADAFVGVLAQRLIRTLCKDCKESYKPDEKEIFELKRIYGEKYFPELGIDEENVQICRPKGCMRCSETGYRGRTGIHELLGGTNTIKEMIVNKGAAAAIRDQAVEEGMRTLRQDGIYKIFKGDIDLKQLRLTTTE